MTLLQIYEINRNKTLDEYRAAVRNYGQVDFINDLFQEMEDGVHSESDVKQYLFDLFE